MMNDDDTVIIVRIDPDIENKEDLFLTNSSTVSFSIVNTKRNKV